MKRMPTLTAGLLLLCIWSLPAFAEDTLNFDFSDIWNSATSQDAPADIAFASDTEFLSFYGIRVFGDITDDDDAKYTISGDIGIFLPENHNGGVLRLEMSGLKDIEEPMALRYFPADEQAMALKSIALNNVPLEIEISAQIQYILLLHKSGAIQVEGISFQEGVTLTENCTCAQIPFGQSTAGIFNVPPLLFTQ